MQSQSPAGRCPEIPYNQIEIYISTAKSIESPLVAVEFFLPFSFPTLYKGRLDASTWQTVLFFACLTRLVKNQKTQLVGKATVQNSIVVWDEETDPGPDRLYLESEPLAVI